MLAVLCSLALAAPAAPSDYAAFKAKVEGLRPSQAHPFVLAVGVPNPAAGTYAPHCTVPGGYLSEFADGLYDCWWDGGKAVMSRRNVPLPMSPAAVAPPATTFAPRPAPIMTPARPLFAPTPSACPGGRCPLQSR